ncbi:transcriptional regulator (plasmid) [Aminobacter sp. Y103A]|uniref:ArsR/SmtB family transcription factor n=1 Tax=Aminobacter sp. Y103A TaxID=1870862 RepID=UPI002573661E|nr:metalloregulator ArsR/SmtB family transcription factor [Aminobacter sp. SS-2016]BBD41024.1 transcriptional regulator [Aminobacter sp. SS-2016]
MLKASDGIESAPVFSALGDVTRLELVSRLSDGQQHSITELAEGLKLTRQGVTKHLRVLKQAGIVHSKRIGRETRFTIKPDPISKARDFLARASLQWDQNIGRLKAFVEE